MRKIRVDNLVSYANLVSIKRQVCFKLKYTEKKSWKWTVIQLLQPKL